MDIDHTSKTEDTFTATTEDGATFTSLISNDNVMIGISGDNIAGSQINLPVAQLSELSDFIVAVIAAQ